MFVLALLDGPMAGRNAQRDVGGMRAAGMRVCQPNVGVEYFERH